MQAKEAAEHFSAFYQGILQCAFSRGAGRYDRETTIRRAMMLSAEVQQAAEAGLIHPNHYVSLRQTLQTAFSDLDRPDTGDFGYHQHARQANQHGKRKKLAPADHF